MREKWLLPVALGLSLAAGVFLVYSYSQWRQVIPLPAANRGKEAIVDQADLPTPHVQDGAELNGVYFNPFSPGSVELERADLRHSGLVLRGTLLGQESLAIVESAVDPSQSWLVREGDEVLGEKILLIGRGWVEVLVNGAHTRRLEAE
ncbi:MAG TPA: hypothetical protein GXZ26_06540 [Firmicutes bacterium]|jgi:hypothetical protein|nr:hypothetical protein [Bacillota bacterium]